MLGTLTITALLGLGALGIGVVWLRKRQEANREAFEALAARRGWSLHLTEQSLGRPALLRLSSRGGPQWSAQSSATQSYTGPAPKTRTTDFISQEPRWPHGYVFYGPAVPQKPDTPVTDAEAADWIRDHIIADGMGADLNGLEQVHGPENLCILATHDPKLRADQSDLSKLWRAWGHTTPQTLISAQSSCSAPKACACAFGAVQKQRKKWNVLSIFALDVARIIGDR